MKINGLFKNKSYALLTLYFPLHFLWYELLRITLADSSDILYVSTELDSKIPFCEWFIIPYCLWYFYIAFMLFYSLKQSKREFLRADLMLTATMFLPMLFCTLCPNGIPLELRPDFSALGRENLATRLVELIYAADTPPRNVFPSVHTSVSCALFFIALRSESLKGRPLFKALCGIFSLSVVLSTVFIKQHSVLDLLAGIGVALPVLGADILIELFIEKRTERR